MQSNVTLTSIEALGFATAAALCAMLLFTHRKVDHSAAAPYNYRWLWFTGFLYACGAFAATCVALSAGESRALRIAESVAWLSTCFGPLVFAEIGDPYVRSAVAKRMLERFAYVAFAVLLLCFIVLAVRSDLHVGGSLLPPSAFYVSAAFALAYLAASSIGRDERAIRAPRQSLKWFPPVATALAILQTIATLAAIHDVGGDGRLRTTLQLISTLWVLPWTILLPLFLARTRYLDVALKRSVILLAAVCMAGLLAAWAPGLELGLPYVAATLTAAAIMLVAPAIHRGCQRFVDRILLHRPEYRVLERAFAERSRRVMDADELFSAAARTIGDALQAEVSFAKKDDSSTTEDTRALAAITCGTQHVLRVHTAADTRSLMQEELEFIERVTLVTRHRLDSLELEAERRESQLREERLQRSVTEAELKALRAQVDPHFLFNTLNAIADLITRNPTQAEAMTERLAECFRYALTRQEKSISTLADELQFIRRYLDIEQIRFGKRLAVDMRQDDGIGAVQVPSLILQPLVENAVRHGLAPKPEGGRLSVVATRDGENLLLEVIDDGIGFVATHVPRVGIGLKNVRDRLQMLYRERARMEIAPGAQGYGTRVTLMLPSHGH